MPVPLFFKESVLCQPVGICDNTSKKNIQHLNIFLGRKHAIAQKEFSYGKNIISLLPGTVKMCHYSVCSTL